MSAIGQARKPQPGDEDSCDLNYDPSAHVGIMPDQGVDSQIAKGRKSVDCGMSASDARS